MLDKVAQILKEKLQGEKSPKLLLAVSGGVDSMVLWAIIRNLGYEHAVAHVNFQLRGAESQADQALIESVGKAENCQVKIKKVDTKAEAKSRGLSIQETARELRYNWFNSLLENDFTHLLTAHHLDDSIETFFINLHRGTGLKGLTGINHRKKLIRPLLNFEKKQIRAFAEANQIKFREDVSNQKTDYLRNWFRLELLPKWEDKNPQFKQTMHKNMARLSELESRVEALVEEDCQSIDLSRKIIELKEIERFRFPKETLMKLFEGYGFNYDTISQLLDSIENGESGKWFKGIGYKLNLDRDKIYVVVNQERQSLHEEVIEKFPQGGKEPLEYTLEEITKAEVDFSKAGVYYFDAEKLDFPLELRPWKIGDRIKPLGMKGSKLVSDVLIDAKVPQAKKDQVYVLASQENICAILGFAVSESFKLDASTNRILAFRWKQ